jgi:hypothetical protein
MVSGRELGEISWEDPVLDVTQLARVYLVNQRKRLALNHLTQAMVIAEAQN